MSGSRRITKGAAAGLLATAGLAVLGLGAPAHAATVPVSYNCVTPIGNKSAVSQVDIAATPSGSSYAVTVTFGNGVSSSPIALAAGVMTPSISVTVGGVDPGSFTANGQPNAASIPANTPIKIGTMTGTYTPRHTGSVTLTPGVLTIRAMGTTTTCTSSGAVAAALTLNVTAVAGASTAHTSSLPRTGPADDAVAFGLFGGTVLLVGVSGALWLTRRNRPGVRL